MKQALRPVNGDGWRRGANGIGEVDEALSRLGLASF